jgi:hypothetical protein
MKFLAFVILSSLGAAYGNQLFLTQNAIVNPGAELGTGSDTGNDIENVPGWSTSTEPVGNGNFTVVQYGPDNGEINISPGAAFPGVDFGDNFFAGGPDNASSYAWQILDVSNVSALINAGLVDYTLAGYFGGYLTQDDAATLTATFFDASANDLGQVSVGGENEVARNGQTELLYDSALGIIPFGTQSIEFTLQMTRTEGIYNDGYADNLSFVAVDPPLTPEPSAWALSGLGIGALLIARRRLR